MTTLDEKIAQTKRALDELTGERARIQALAPEHRLAEQLHEALCTWNHTDGCGWFYEIGDGNMWNRDSHQRWLKKAEAITAKLPDFSVDQIIEYVWVIVDAPYSRCGEYECDCGDVLHAVYASEQTAKQHAARHGGRVSRQSVLTKVRDY